MSRGAVNVILPERLYQRAHFLTWPYSQKQALLRQHRIDVVVNLWRPLDSDLAGPHRFVYLGVHMAGNSVPPEADSTVRYVAALLRAGKVALVHCEAGKNRSAWFCTRLLMELGHFSAHEALRIVHERIPQADINGALLADIEGQ
jgi:hypothetical protein